MRFPTLIGLGLVLVLGCSRAPQSPAALPSPPLDVPCPPLVARGWLNGTPPTTSDLRDRFMVIDCWGHWCAPCRATAPRLVKLYEEFAQQGVVFVGLTADGVDALNEIKTHLAHLKIPWPNGYGAAETMQSLQVNSLPSRLLVGPNGRILWRGEDVRQLRQALQRSLAPSGVEAPPAPEAETGRGGVLAPIRLIDGNAPTSFLPINDSCSAVYVSSRQSGRSPEPHTEFGFEI